MGIRERPRKKHLQKPGVQRGKLGIQVPWKTQELQGMKEPWMIQGRLGIQWLWKTQERQDTQPPGRTREPGMQEPWKTQEQQGIQACQMTWARQGSQQGMLQKEQKKGMREHWWGSRWAW